MADFDRIRLKRSRTTFLSGSRPPRFARALTPCLPRPTPTRTADRLVKHGPFPNIVRNGRFRTKSLRTLCCSRPPLPPGDFQTQGDSDHDDKNNDHGDNASRQRQRHGRNTRPDDKDKSATTRRDGSMADGDDRAETGEDAEPQRPERVRAETRRRTPTVNRAVRQGGASRSAESGAGNSHLRRSAEHTSKCGCFRGHPQAVRFLRPISIAPSGQIVASHVTLELVPPCGNRGRVGGVSKPDMLGFRKGSPVLRCSHACGNEVSQSRWSPFVYWTS